MFLMPHEEQRTMSDVEYRARLDLRPTSLFLIRGLIYVRHRCSSCETSDSSSPSHEDFLLQRERSWEGEERTAAIGSWPS